MSNDREAWLAALAPGDRVAVHPGYRVGTRPAIYTTTVKRRTPTGRIVTSTDSSSGEQVFKPDGFLIVPARTTLYADRHLEPIEGSTKE
jgi:hypothetical protein